MIAISTLREHFGLTQAALANLLNISVSLLKMIESGNRSLSGEATEKYMDLVNLVKTGAGVVQQPATLLIKDQQLALLALSKYIKNTTDQLRRYQVELAQMTIHHQQALHRQVLLQAMKDKSGMAIDAPWLQVLMYKTAEQLQTNGVKARAVLQLKIDSCSYSLEKALQLEQQLKEQ